ncbi:MAG: phosphoenolpyruvate--protein phosphotransferase [Pyrinomonadaceae bacterium]
MEEKALSKKPVSDAELKLSATAVSRGIGIGRAVFLNGAGFPTDRTGLTPPQIEYEIERLRSARISAKTQLEKLLTNDDNGLPESALGIFDVHLLILDGSALIPTIENEIRDERVNAERAIRTVSQSFADRQRSVTDEGLSERYLDVKDVADRLLQALGTAVLTGGTPTGSICVVKELMPSSLMELAKQRPAALISEHGGWTSHTSILARELKLPVVTGIRNIERLVSVGDQIIVDAVRGEVVIHPTTQTIENLFPASNQSTNSLEYRPNVDKDIKTIDGHKIIIRANADSTSAYLKAANFGADGIGLYRSEVIFNKFNRFPSETEQVLEYSQIASAAGESGVRIRTFDVGVDQLEGDQRVIERNPSLGLRSIRLSLTNPSYFRTQIRAILQAAFRGKIDIVLPMVSGVGEVIRLRQIIEEERLSLEGLAISVGVVGLGAMIEVPSAVMTADAIARNVDFLCLGTNDLVQYTLAVDRDNEAIAGWYQTLHPAVIRSIRDVITAGENADIPVAVCGEIAGSPFYLPLLLGLGARELSMNVNSIPGIRHLISGITLSDAIQLSDSIKECELAEEIESILREYYLQKWSHLFPKGFLSSQYP